MKIKNVAIKNFRGYSDEINSDFEDLTAFVGKNDIGKSTILEALDMFFNDGKGVTKLDKADLNVESKARQEAGLIFRCPPDKTGPVHSGQSCTRCLQHC